MPVARLQRLDHLAFDGQVDFGGEVVALLGDRGFGAVAGDERPGRVVEDRGGRGDQRVEIGVVGASTVTGSPRPAPAAA